MGHSIGIIATSMHMIFTNVYVCTSMWTAKDMQATHPSQLKVHPQVVLPKCITVWLQQVQAQGVSQLTLKNFTQAKLHNAKGVTK